VRQDFIDQRGIQIFRDLYYLAAGHSVDEAIFVVIGLTGFGVDESTPFHHDEIILGYDAVGSAGVWIGELRAQRGEKIIEYGLLSGVGFGPRGCSGNGPVNVIGEMVKKGLVVGLRHFRTDELNDLLVLNCIHAAIILQSNIFVQSMDRIMAIHSMNLASLDLNLLVALDALLSEAHVGRAAARIGLSQPAASHALKRLRELLDDPLLVRTGARMELTPRGQALRAPLVEALEQVRGLFAPDSFDPRTSARRFALMMPDHVVDLVVPPLLQRVVSEAPNVRLDVAPWLGPSVMTAEVARSIDLVIACAGDAFPSFERQRCFADTEALAVRRGHPAGARLRRLDEFLHARHVAVVGRGRQEDPVDTWLREEGVERRIALAVPSYQQALHMAAHTDLVAFVPRRLIETMISPLSLVVVTPPIDPGKYEEFLFHPTRAQGDPGSIWLRNLALRIGRRLDRSEAPIRRAI